MLDEISVVKKKLNEAISQLCKVSWMFVKDPVRDFTKKRKLPFDKVISFLLAMEGGSLTTEMLRHFGCSCDIASNSALVQQRGKIHPSAFSSLFDLFVQKTNKDLCYKGFRLLAADGSDIQIPTNSNDPDSYFPAKEGQSAYNLLHLDAMYDLLRHTYTDAVLVGQRKANERSSLCDMVDRSALKNVLVIADRGYEGFNLMAHIQEKRLVFSNSYSGCRKFQRHGLNHILLMTFQPLLTLHPDGIFFAAGVDEYTLATLWIHYHATSISDLYQSMVELMEIPTTRPAEFLDSVRGFIQFDLFCCFIFSFFLINKHFKVHARKKVLLRLFLLVFLLLLLLGSILLAEIYTKNNEISQMCYQAYALLDQDRKLQTDLIDDTAFQDCLQTVKYHKEQASRYLFYGAYGISDRYTGLWNLIEYVVQEVCRFFRQKINSML